MAAHSSILALEVTWTEEPGGLQSMGLQRVRLNDLATKQQQSRARFNTVFSATLPMTEQMKIKHDCPEL